MQLEEACIRLPACTEKKFFGGPGPGASKKTFWDFAITSRRSHVFFHAEQRGVSRFPEKSRSRFAQITFRILKMHGRSKKHNF